jgi:hypothetical protein
MEQRRWVDSLWFSYCGKNDIIISSVLQWKMWLSDKAHEKVRALG